MGQAKTAGHSILYENRFPFATGPGYYAIFREDPDRIKVEVVARVMPNWALNRTHCGGPSFGLKKPSPNAIPPQWAG